MRIKTITLTWFRGAADPVTLELAGKSVVVYGKNGAGKSSFVDAIEYVLHGGKLAHLSHEYSGQRQEKAIPNTHIPDGENTNFSIQFVDDAKLEVAIAKTGTHTKGGAGADKMNGWDYGRTVLRQDELARFIHSRKGEKYSALLPLFGLHELEVAAENIHQLIPVVEKQAELVKKKTLVDQSIVKRKLAFEVATDDEIAAMLSELHKKYCPASATIRTMGQCAEIAAELTRRVSDLSAEKLRYLDLRTIAGSSVIVAAQSVRDANATLAQAVEPLIAEKLELLNSAHAYAEKLAPGGEVSCPACGKTLQIGEFKSHIAAEKERLSEITNTFNDRRGAIATLIDDLKTLKTTLAKNVLRDWREALQAGALAVELEWIASLNPEGLRAGLAADDLTAVETNCPGIIAAAGALSQFAPPEIGELTADSATNSVANAVFDAQELAAEIARVDGLVAFLVAAETGVREEIRHRSESVISALTCDISAIWKLLHPTNPIENVRLYLPEEDKAIDIALKFYGKEQDSPRLTLSEGYRNSLGLCIFLAMAKRETRSDRPILLDDVVVSFDRGHRGMILEVLQKLFGDRQIAIFTHDRDWYAELRRFLNDKHWKFRTLLPYDTPAIGIRWSHKTTTFDEARAFLDTRPDAAGNDARKIMDTEFAILAERLNLEMPFRRGDANDHRMAYDFLEVAIKDGKKCLQIRKDEAHAQYTGGLVALEEAKRSLAAWANRGSHSFDLEKVEAAKLIDRCEIAMNVFRCATCDTSVFFADAASREWVQCQCGSLRWRYGKA